MSEWYYAVGNEQKGPINEAELKEFLAGGKLAADTLVWQDGMEAWAAANAVPKLAFRAPPAPARVQPTAAVASAPLSTLTSPGEPALAPVVAASPESAPATVFGSPETLVVNADDAERHKIFGLLAYVGILWLVPLLAAPASPFARYHANQGLVLFILEVILSVCFSVVLLTLGLLLPYSISGPLTMLLNLPVYGGPLVLAILGIIKAAQGQCAPLPLIGGIKILR